MLSGASAPSKNLGTPRTEGNPTVRTSSSLRRSSEAECMKPRKTSTCSKTQRRESLGESISLNWLSKHARTPALQPFQRESKMLWLSVTPQQQMSPISKGPWIHIIKIKCQVDTDNQAPTPSHIHIIYLQHTDLTLSKNKIWPRVRF